MVLDYPIEEIDEEDYDSSNNFNDNYKEEQSYDVLKFKQLMQDTK